MLHAMAVSVTAPIAISVKPKKRMVFLGMLIDNVSSLYYD